MYQAVLPDPRCGNRLGSKYSLNFLICFWCFYLFIASLLTICHMKTKCTLELFEQKLNWALSSCLGKPMLQHQHKENGKLPLPNLWRCKKWCIVALMIGTSMCYSENKREGIQHVPGSFIQLLLRQMSHRGDKRLPCAWPVQVWSEAG